MLFIPWRYWGIILIIGIPLLILSEIKSDPQDNNTQQPEVRKIDDITTPVEKALFVAMNKERVEAKQEPLEWMPELAMAARLHTADMVAGSYYSHTGRDGSSPQDRVKRITSKCSQVSENLSILSKDVYETPTIAQRFTTGWMESPGHRRNMLDSRWTKVGISYHYGKTDHILQYSLDANGGLIPQIFDKFSPTQVESPEVV